MAFDDILNLWEELDELAHPYLAPIKTVEQHQETIAFLEVLWNKTAGNSNSPYSSLLSVVTKNISTYETAHHDIADAEPGEVLTYLMEERGLTQKEARGSHRHPPK